MDERTYLSDFVVASIDLAICSSCCKNKIARQNVPYKSAIELGQIGKVADEPRIPALKINSASVISPHFDKRLLAKRADIFELLSESKTKLSLSLLDPAQ